MNLKNGILIILISFLTINLYTSENDNKFFKLKYINKAEINIDGINNDWPLTIPHTIGSDSQIQTGLRENPDDIDALVYIVFDKNNLYLFLDCTDKTPLRNNESGFFIWKGDCLEIFIGFHEENKTSYSSKDFQFGIKMKEDDPETYIFSKGKALKNETIKILKTDYGYTAEAKIPLTNFGIESVNSGDIIWFDFALDNGEGRGRKAQIVWYGDNEGHLTPVNWAKGKLSSNNNDFEKLTIIKPNNIILEKYNKIHIWYKGKPYIGNIQIENKNIKTDNKGGFSIIPNENTQDITLKINGKKIVIPFELKKYKYVQLPIKEIKVNQHGYETNESKYFILTDNEKKIKNQTYFSIISIQTGKEVYNGKLSEKPRIDMGTNDIIYYGDFSDFIKKGTFLINVNGFESSYEFKIKDNIYKDLFYTTMRSYYLQRCGIKIDDKISGIKYEECHLEDGYLVKEYRNNNKKIKLDVSKGWHDAGDYGKYMPTAGLTTTQLLMLVEYTGNKLNNISLDIPESNNATPDLIDEIKYELDWMLKMQAKNGAVYHKVNTKRFPPVLLPHLDKDDRLIYEIGTADTAIFAGAMAYAARIFKDIDNNYAKKLNKAAVQAGKYLIKNDNKIVRYPSNDETGAYKSDSVSDELFWAYSELFRLTNNNKYLKMALKYKGKNYEMPIIGWENTYVLGLYALYSAKKTPENIKNQIKDFLLNNANNLVKKINSNGYKVSLLSTEYTWASNKNACAKGLTLVVAYEIFNNLEYLKAAKYQLNYILGINALSKSFITNIGTDYVRYPHHRIVEASETLIPGLLIGGPNSNAECGTYLKHLGAKGYIDNNKAYSCNEYAIDYNAPLVFLAGYFVQGNSPIQYIEKENNTNILSNLLFRILSVILMSVIIIFIILLLYILLKKKNNL